MAIIAEILCRESRVCIIDNGDNDVQIAYGKKGDGQFIVHWRRLLDYMVHSEPLNDLCEEVSFDTGMMTITRTKDFLGDELLSVDEISEEYKIGNIYKQRFSLIETDILIGFLKERSTRIKGK